MDRLKLVVAAALLVAPASGQAQEANAELGQKQKPWMVANFRTVDCASVSGAAITGRGTASFDTGRSGGVDVIVRSGDGGVATITAHAINTKGTGATNGRMAAQTCPTAEGPPSAAAACSVSGDEQSPSVRFLVPLTALGSSGPDKAYVGTVTIVKHASTDSLIGIYLSKKGYDYYQAQGWSSGVAAANDDLLVIATCDSAKLVGKGGKPSVATYDLAVGKK